MAKTALVPIADGTEEMEAVTIINVLRRGGVQVTAASVSGRTVTGSRSVTLSADRLIGDCLDQTYDLIALPGGMPGAEHLRDCKPLVEMLKKQKKRVFVGGGGFQGPPRLICRNRACHTGKPEARREKQEIAGWQSGNGE